MKYSAIFFCAACGTTLQDINAEELTAEEMERECEKVAETGLEAVVTSCCEQLKYKKFIIHHCDNGNIGIARFAGFKKVEE